MKQILVLGATGHLGKVLTKRLLEKQFPVVVLVRNLNKLKIQHANLTSIEGDVTNYDDVSKALNNSDIVISALGHGFRTSYPIQENTLKILLPLMEKKRISRFITVTGAGLTVTGDPKSLIGTASDIFLPYIDPYRMSDARAQQQLLEQSTIDWTVVRTPIHSNKTNQKIIQIGLKQPMPWRTLSRQAICDFIISCIEERKWIKKSPIIY